MDAVHVGQRASRQKPITRRDVELFTELTGDHQALHYDEALAARLGYPAPIVQGGIITGILNAIVAHDLPGEGSVFLHVDWRFRHAVCIGDVITGEVEVLSLREDKPLIELRTAVTNQDGVLCLDGTALVYRRDIT
ncbi:MAG TPA: MaoC family dehydratase [Ktedonobacterales bacterium]